MTKILWEFVNPLKDNTILDVIEMKYHYLIPADLRACIEENNAGIPFPCTFDMGENTGMVFGGLLSFNVGDVDSFFDFIDLFKDAVNNGLSMFPFGLDPAGNFYCIEDSEVVFYDHEADKTTRICKTFRDFMNMLHN